MKKAMTTYTVSESKQAKKYALVETQTYKKLIGDIFALYVNARRLLVRTYWQIGRRIVESEQEGKERAAYGDEILKRLSMDLTKKCGKGFSPRNLKRMRRFYLQNRIGPTSAQLAWSTHVELLEVKHKAVRLRLVKKIVREKLSVRDVRKIVGSTDSRPKRKKGKGPLAPTKRREGRADIAIHPQRYPQLRARRQRTVSVCKGRGDRESWIQSLVRAAN